MFLLYSLQNSTSVDKIQKRKNRGIGGKIMIMVFH
jgi:hypothetical protein